MTHSHPTDLDTVIDNVIDKARHRLDGLRETQERVDHIRIRVASPNGLVTVVADGTGAMVGLDLAEDLGSVTARELASTIVLTAAEAASAALDLRETILQSLQASFTDS
ncbi:YbaB/EbfC family nucleoid-associated protein [Rhodococcus fascians]|uniref:YbaB/EbfC family nucleoid-associated protein n=1 Tax=Nocardiaceae TaxID=85025 RepID=UPI000691D7C1|nr:MULTISPECIES: YbaB/EbfC family nucleoid-associated protein [Rhodococcus]MDP9637143.1 DNA-binding protein YbaB [Rhodococcus cercidiphylli]AMY51480.1 Nucleoid-associated protein YbaB [Rhodococcus fascians D188]MBY4039865.1 YbaB/EbfC family nucleoid-associated protein [Rhodococcus fascians]MBY4141259.1 YbaB/EbfC family nucleoid-associated protein [Rhodococcus fascians]MBY4219866.1 YbaB/EbfC family nucleoid-associated protein [Rhodococcus fascians]